MIKKLLSLFLISSLITSNALGDISNSTVSAFISDSSGNSISSTGGSLNSNITNTVPVSQSGVWTVSVSGSSSVTQGTSPWVDNISQFGGNNVVTGTGASGVGIPRMTVSNDSNILATQSGTWNITNISGTVSLPTGAATSANQTNGSQETQLIDGSGHLGTIKAASTAAIATDTSLVVALSPNSPVPTGANSIGTVGLNAGANLIGSVNQGTSPWVSNVSQFGGSNVVTGTGASGAGIPRVTVSSDSNVLATQSGTWNINNVSGTVSLPTGAATSANQTNGTQKSQIVDGSGNVIASTSNALNTFVTNVGQAQAAASIPVVTQGDFLPATQNVTVQDTASTTTTVLNSQVFYTGTPTAGSAASFSTPSFENVQVLVTGTWTGTLQSEISQDSGVTWTTRGLKQSGAAYLSSSFTANFQGEATIAGMTNYRIRATAAMTGTAVVRINASIHPSSIIVSNPLTLRDSTTQSIANTIKAASTAAGAADTSLVVGLSPNSPLPTGANSLGTVGLNAGANLIGSVNQGTSPWVSNISQFGGNAVVTGTGASGVGIPRVTVSNDSNILATQSGTWTVQQGTPPWSQNLTQVAGSSVSTAATGIQKVGITGNTGAAMDAAGQNAASPANELLIAGQFNTSPSTITPGNVSPLQLDASANLKVNLQTAIPAGANTIGAVTQASGPWTSNLTQIAGSSVSTAATGTQKVGIVGNAGAAFDQAIGSAIPANALFIGGTDGTNIRAPGVQSLTTNPPASSYYIQVMPMTYNYKNLSGAATTTVKSGAGVLHEFCTNNNDLTATATLFDNTAGSGTIIATVTQTFGGGTNPVVNCILHDVNFGTGLTVVTTGATANFTAVWK